MTLQPNLTKLHRELAHCLHQKFSVPPSFDATIPEFLDHIEIVLGTGNTRAAARSMKLLVALFVPAHYRHSARLSARTSDFDAFVHFIKTGWRRDHEFSPLFDVQYYRDAVAANPTVRSIGNMPAFQHFLTEGVARRIVPTPRFDEAYYLRRYPDLGSANLFGFVHFVEFGQHEGRQPTIWFDPQFMRAYGPSDEAGQDETGQDYVNALLHQIPAGTVSCQLLHRMLGQKVDPAQMSLASYDRICQASSRWMGEPMDDALLLFIPEAYDGAGDLSPSATTLERVSHFFEIGLARGDTIGPLLEASTYCDNVARAGLSKPDMPLPLHFAHVGLPGRIMPNSLFCETTYLTGSPDLTPETWGFQHFITNGMYENRAFTATPRPRVHLLEGPWRAAEVRRGVVLAAGRLPVDICAEEGSRLQLFLDSQNSLQKVMTAPETLAVMAEMREIEPAIGILADISNLMIPPFHDPIALPYRAILSRLPRRNYNTILIVDSIQRGPSGRWHAALIDGLRRLRADERVLVIATDAGPGGTAAAPDGSLDVSDILATLDSDITERLLYALFCDLAPDRIVLSNSRQGWNCLRRFGQRMSSRIRLHAQIIAGQNPPLETGPIDLYAATAPFLASVMVNAPSLAAALARRYMLPQALASRMVTLVAPAAAPPPRLTAAERAAATLSRRRRAAIFWAEPAGARDGSEVLDQVATLLPSISFHCWGRKPGARTGGKSPANIIDEGAFVCVGDVAHRDCDGWLLTSRGSEMLGMVIDLATLGASVVAAGAGDLAPLIDLETAWGMPADAGDGIWAAAVQQLVNEPQTRILRGQRLQARVVQLYNKCAYDAVLEAALA